MAWVRTMTLSDGTEKVTTIRVPHEEAAKLNVEMSWVAEAWDLDRLHRRDSAHAEAIAINRAIERERREAARQAEEARLAALPPPEPPPPPPPPPAPKPLRPVLVGAPPPLRRVPRP